MAAIAIIWAIIFQSGVCLAQEAIPTAVAAIPNFDLGAIWAQIQVWIEIVSQLALALTVIATILLRVIPSKYRASVEGVAGSIMKFIHWMPTLGMNPRTKDLETAIVELKKQLPEEKPAEPKS
jgi:hypothetical protein